ncbi:MAG: EutN/CcmL family microcompartment protein [Clostridia bacterium]|nr:EutN/CcmL family microcompartment protein [Clostridia bacterium]
MFLGKVIGTVVSTKKDERLIGHKLLIIKPLSFKNDTGSKPMVAIDLVGCGVGETVLVVQGSTASRSLDKENAPVDAAVVGIVDTIETAGSKDEDLY